MKSEFHALSGDNDKSCCRNVKVTHAIIRRSGKNTFWRRQYIKPLMQKHHIDRIKINTVATHTLMMQQYLSIEAEHPTRWCSIAWAIFMSCFFNYASKAAKLLDITLTQHANSKACAMGSHLVLGQFLTAGNLLTMARTLRLEYPGAVHHVRSRGNAGHKIYRAMNKTGKSFSPH